MGRVSGWLVVGLLVLSVGVGLGWWAKPVPVLPLPPLPKEVVIEKVVDRPVKTAPQVIEKIRFVSQPSPIPEQVIEVVKEQIPGECTLSTYPQAIAVVEAEKWLGAGPDGKPAFGWKGQAGCDYLVDSTTIPGPRTPLNYTASVAEVAKEIGPQRLVRLRPNLLFLSVNPVDHGDLQITYQRLLGNRFSVGGTMGKVNGKVYGAVGFGFRW